MKKLLSLLLKITKNSPEKVFGAIYLSTILIGFLIAKNGIVLIIFYNVLILLFVFWLIGRYQNLKRYFWTVLLFISLLNLYFYPSLYSQMQVDKRKAGEIQNLQDSIDKLINQDEPDFVLAIDKCISYFETRLYECNYIQEKYAEYIVNEDLNETSEFLAISKKLITEKNYFKYLDSNYTINELSNIDIHIKPCRILIKAGREQEVFFTGLIKDSEETLKAAEEKIDTRFMCKNLAKVYNNFHEGRDQQLRYEKWKREQNTKEGLQSMGKFFGNITGSVGDAFDVIKEPIDEIKKGYNSIK